jgi:threonine-phosphate decarboxylase
LANTAFIEQTRQRTSSLRRLLHQALQSSGLFARIYPGQANFLLAQLASDGNGHHLQRQLESTRILIRVCDNFAGLDSSHLRFAVKNEQAIEQLAHSLKALPLKVGYVPLCL